MVGTKRRKYLWGIAFIAQMTLSGCVVPIQQGAPPPPSNGAPVQVDLAKWSSGMYPDLYANKRVIAEGYFLRPNMGQGDFHQGAPQIDFVIASVPLGYGDKPPTTYAEMAAYTKQVQNYVAISAYAPLAMRDQIFALKGSQRIRVYGYAQQTGVYNTLFGKQYTGVVGLALVADTIEPLGP
jgi:hypothetical protein